MLVPLSASAFDNDYSINRPNLNNENFLDINSVQFSDSLNQQWYQADNGWRMTGHSVSTDLLYTDSEIKLMSELAGSVTVYFSFKQDIFYADKPLKDPLLEIEISPLDLPLSFSILSTTDYTKADVVMGLAITVGDRKKNYLRISELTVDPLFNEKNSAATIDQARYTDYQHIWSVEGFYASNNGFEARFSVRDLSTLNYQFDDTITTFSHGGYEYDVDFRYKVDTDRLWKLSLKGFKTDKSLSTTGSDQIQQLTYDAINLQWLIRQTTDYPLSFGLRKDDLHNVIGDALDSSHDLDYRFRTTQIYSTLQHTFSERKTWNLGLYIGLTQEPNDFEETNTAVNAHVYESQLRTSWIFSSLNNKSSLQLHLTFNLDELTDDPGDGVGMSYQSVF
jgi:hypothetical protein